MPDFLLDPNVAYIVLMAGALLALLALATPGTGLLEIGALFLHCPGRIWSLYPVLQLVGAPAHGTAVPFPLHTHSKSQNVSHFLSLRS